MPAPTSNPSQDPGMSTPLAPIPASERGAAEGAGGRRPSSRRGRRRGGGEGGKERGRKGGRRGGVIAFGIRQAFHAWRPLLVVLLVQILLALTVTAPFRARVSARLDRHAHAAALAGSPTAVDAAEGWSAGLDGGIWRDLKRLEEETFQGLAAAFLWVALVAILFGAVAAGGFLGLAVEPKAPATAGRFFALGGRHFGRMLRVTLVLLVLVYLAARLVYEAWGGAAKTAELAAGTSASVFWGRRIRDGVFLLFFLWMRVAADLGRADLVVFARRSAFLAFFRGLGRTLRHPLRTFGLALAVGAPALLLLLGLAFLRPAVVGATWVPLVGAFLLYQVAVWIRWTSRAALLSGDARLVAELAKRPA
jgi:hypothetical protein